MKSKEAAMRNASRDLPIYDDLSRPLHLVLGSRPLNASILFLDRRGKMVLGNIGPGSLCRCIGLHGSLSFRATHFSDRPGLYGISQMQWWAGIQAG